MMGEDFVVEEAEEWTTLFKRSSGWFGGDGIFAIPLNGKEYESSSQTKNLVIFCDSMIGEIEGDSLMPGFSMVNNSLAYLGNYLQPTISNSIGPRIHKASPNLFLYGNAPDGR